MRYVIYGAGAVGGVVGGRLFEHGHDVVLIARGEHGRAMAEGGLQLESPDGVSTLPVPVVAHPAELALGPADVVLLAMKSQDTVSALADLAATAPPTVAVVCLQNGVANERAALRRFPHVYAVPVMCPALHLRPGVVQAYSSPVSGILDVGRYPSGVDSVAEAVAAALAASTFSSEARPDIMRWKWAKLLLNLGNAVEAVCGPSARSGRLAELVRSEGVACLRAAGIDFASQEEERGRRGDLLRMRPIAGERRPGGSSWQSLARGTGTIEADYLNGEVVFLGRLHGVPTRANELLQRRANELARSGQEPGTVDAEELFAELSPAV